jgi:Predicted transcriptional regulator
MRWWEHAIGGAARGRIIGLLRRGRRTVDEIATSAGVTDNAVRAQLHCSRVQASCAPREPARATAAGKPATVFEIDPAAEAALSGAYAPVLGALLDTLAERNSPEELERLLRDAGHRLGTAVPQKKKSLETRVAAAADVLTGLGAEIDVERIAGGFRLKGYACPLSAAVRQHPAACQVVEQFVADMVDAPTTECCDRTDGARCRFEIKAS